MALVEASGAVVSMGEHLNRVWQGQDRRREPAAGHKTATLRKGFSAGRELIPMVADGFTGSPARSARSAGTGGQVRLDRHEGVHPGSVVRAAGSPYPAFIDRQKKITRALSAGPPSVASEAAVFVVDESGYVKVRDWRKRECLHQCGDQASTGHQALGGLPGGLRRTRHDGGLRAICRVLGGQNYTTTQLGEPEIPTF
jgi:hypothetical protein